MKPEDRLKLADPDEVEQFVFDVNSATAFALFAVEQWARGDHSNLLRDSIIETEYGRSALELVLERLVVMGMRQSIAVCLARDVDERVSKFDLAKVVNYLRDPRDYGLRHVEGTALYVVGLLAERGHVAEVIAAINHIVCVHLLSDEWLHPLTEEARDALTIHLA